MITVITNPGMCRWISFYTDDSVKNLIHLNADGENTDSPVLSVF